MSTSLKALNQFVILVAMADKSTYDLELCCNQSRHNISYTNRRWLANIYHRANVYLKKIINAIYQFTAIARPSVGRKVNFKWLPSSGKPEY